MSTVENKNYRLRDGIELNLEIQESGKKNWLIVTHGVGEHLGRHLYINKLFSGSFNILKYDLRGHGKSSGKRAYVEEFYDYMEDLLELVKYLRSTYHMTSYCLFGHSMGALITAGFLQRYAKPGMYPSRVFLSAPPVQVSGILGNVIDLIPIQTFGLLKKIEKSLALSGLVDLKYLSHNSKIEQEYISDELNNTKLHSKLLLEMIYASKEIFSRPLRPNCPLYVAVGSGDKVVGVQAVIDYFSNIEKAVSLKVIEGGFHELHNEIDKYREPYLDFLQHSLEKSVFLTENVL